MVLPKPAAWQWLWPAERRRTQHVPPSYTPTMPSVCARTPSEPHDRALLALLNTRTSRLCSKPSISVLPWPHRATPCRTRDVVRMHTRVPVLTTPGSQTGPPPSRCPCAAVPSSFGRAMSRPWKPGARACARGPAPSKPGALPWHAMVSSATADLVRHRCGIGFPSAHARAPQPRLQAMFLALDHMFHNLVSGTASPSTLPWSSSAAAGRRCPSRQTSAPPESRRQSPPWED